MFSLSEKSSTTKKLFWLAIIFSPLIGSISFAPIFMFVSTLNQLNDLQDFSYPRAASGAVISSLVVFIQWMANIALLRVRNNAVRITISYVFSLVFFLGVSFIVRSIRADFPENAGIIRYYPLVNLLANNAITLLIIGLVTAQRARMSLELEKSQIENKALRLQHEQLIHQIEPHFLFNALSTLKAMISESAKDSERYLQKLSDFLRTAIQNRKNKLVSIDEEIDVLERYLELQRIRFKRSVQFENGLPSSFSSSTFIPNFTLQFLAENAIKHNRFSREQPLLLRLYANLDSEIVFENNLKENTLSQNSTGFGIDNLKQRFELLGLTTPIFIKSPEQETFRVKILNLHD